jgi:hypothetical protein
MHETHYSFCYRHIRLSGFVKCRVFRMCPVWSDQPYRNDVAPVLNLSPKLVSKEGHR